MNRAFLFAVGIALLSIYYARRKHQAGKRQRRVPAQGERVAIIGCSSGIGRELALCYAGRGAKLALFARRSELIEILKQDCEAAGSPLALGVAGDVTKTEDLESLVDQVRRILGGVDTLIYCAGMISVRLFLDASGIKVERQQQDDTTFKVVQKEDSGQALDQALDRINSVNYTAAVRCVRLFLPLLIETSKAPNIIAISSLAGKVGAPTRSLYAGSKHALHGFLDSLRVEVQPLGVHIGIVCPGTVDTDLRNSAVDHDLGTGAVAGSKKGKLTPRQVALTTINASDSRAREVYIPAWMGYSAIWAKLVASSWVDWAAAQKYKVVP